MNGRKFILIMSTVLSAFMFLLGVLALGYINLVNAESIQENSNSEASKTSYIDSIVNQYKTSNKNINILVLGGDKVAKNTDTMMLVNFNPQTAKINILSIPRDTKVKIKGKTAKINAAYPGGGGDRAMECVSDLLGVDIKYYVFINTATFRDIIDILDGVDYDVPENMNYDDPIQNLHIHLEKGMQHFDGKKAEQYMRFRKGTNMKGSKNYDGSDLKRIDAQQNFIRELIRQKVNVFYITKLNSILNKVFSNIETNIEMEEVFKLSKNISKIDADSINMMKLNGTSVNEGASYYKVDKEETEKIVDQYFRDN